ncbi:Putative aldo/keto reductase, NADP-dependent oxidoreductase domain-containing protein [Septoria linicola]|uniref:Aldo/keto reductase, NADP-dependent oxidoreductase domain-containing protein n=1 Tax=Septoria linicola TaxID=215465 RepID=A0A9Q9B4I8_9PEZI|nr:Putative aldo/keto reductase, NADP-dependent oxidoreductase domain-containing protein [Septoria linicola]
MDQSSKQESKMAHVNLMTDTIVANLSEHGLRSVLRAMLATDPSITKTLEQRTKIYLAKYWKDPTGPLFTSHGDGVTSVFREWQAKLRVMLGCGRAFESLATLTSIVKQTSLSSISVTKSDTQEEILSSEDGDIIQALTAVQKTLLTPSGSRMLDEQEEAIVSELYHRPLPEMVETFLLDNEHISRLFSGLWQLSSPSWGTASMSQIEPQFSRYASLGFTAYDMADHYGDAELVFGRFRSSCSDPKSLFGATKYCIFTPTTISKEVVAANVTERCQRMSADYIDLLQFHWQDYSDPQYLSALQHLQDDPRVRSLGLCNFDTEHMCKILSAGIQIATNQVQFSLIDSRPLISMAEVCQKHDIKLLTYGPLLGGFLSAKWLRQPEPRLFADAMTPSQRKYYDMILTWGSWELFQELLEILEKIAEKHGSSVSNVATSDNADENLKVYAVRLNEEDKQGIESVLRRSRRDEMVKILGDCGGEYR